MPDLQWGNVSAVFKDSVVSLIGAYTEDLVNLREAHAREVSELRATIECLSAGKATEDKRVHANGIRDAANDIILSQGDFSSTPVQSYPIQSCSEALVVDVSPATHASSSAPRDAQPAGVLRELSPGKEIRPSKTQASGISAVSEVDATWYISGERDTSRRHKCKSADDPLWGSRKNLSESRCADCVLSTHFEIVFAALIILNAVYIGIQTELDPAVGDPGWHVFFWMDHVFGLAFTAELVMRFMAMGCYRYLWGSSEKGWHCLDIVIVVLSWIEAGVQISARVNSGRGELFDMSPIRMLRMIRFARVARVVRVGRIFKMVRSFRFLVIAILHSLQSVIWSLVMILVMIYIFALVLRQAAKEIQDSGGSTPADFDLYWGSLPASMFTLFKSIAGGLSWHECVLPLEALDPIWTAVFILYICFSTFAVFNVITGVFCESAIEGAQSDRELAVQKHMEMRSKYEETARRLFKEIDCDGSKCITLQEFEAHWSSDEAAAFFKTMDIEADQAWELFRLLDKDTGGDIDIEEFVYGCLHLSGNATAMHAANLTMMTTGMDSRLTRLRQEQKKQSAQQRMQSEYIRALYASIRPLLEAGKLRDDGFEAPCESHNITEHIGNVRKEAFNGTTKQSPPRTLGASTIRTPRTPEE